MYRGFLAEHLELSRWYFQQAGLSAGAIRSLVSQAVFISPLNND
jgi:hypothetical protein